MASLDEVARAAGVSTATVSRALSGRGRTSEATRAHVREVAATLGYVASATASSLASGRAENIGVVVPLWDRWFFAKVLDGIATRLAGHGYDLTLYNLTDDPDQRLRLFATSLRRGRVDGVIVLSAGLSDDEVAQLGDLGRPVLGLGLPRGGLPTLRVDDTAVGRAAAEHLLGLGHRRIAHLGQSVGTDPGADAAGRVADPCRAGAVDALAAPGATDTAAKEGATPAVSEGRTPEFDIPTRRRRGFEAAMADAGVADPVFVAADFTVEGGRRAAHALLAAPAPPAPAASPARPVDGDADRAPTAIFAASDEMAFGVLAAARELGLRVPEDLSVLGVDGHDLGGLFDLTTIDQFPRAQGEQAADAILAAVSSPTATTAEVSAGAPAPLPFSLVVRGTTAAPR